MDAHTFSNSQWPSWASRGLPWVSMTSRDFQFRSTHFLIYRPAEVENRAKRWRTQNNRTSRSRCSQQPVSLSTCPSCPHPQARPCSCPISSHFRGDFHAPAGQTRPHLVDVCQIRPRPEAAVARLRVGTLGGGQLWAVSLGGRVAEERPEVRRDEIVRTSAPKLAPRTRIGTTIGATGAIVRGDTDCGGGGGTPHNRRPHAESSPWRRCSCKSEPQRRFPHWNARLWR